MRYLRLSEVFNRWRKRLLWDASSQGNIYRAFFWLGKCLSGMCLVGAVTVGDVSGWGSVHRGCVCSGKYLSGKCPSGKSRSRMCPGIFYTSFCEILLIHTPCLLQKLHLLFYLCFYLWIYLFNYVVVSIIYLKIFILDVHI